MTSGSVIEASTRHRPPQWSHTNTSSAKTFLRRSAQGIRRAGEGLAATPALCVTAAGGTGTTDARSFECGAKTPWYRVR